MSCGWYGSHTRHQRACPYGLITQALGGRDFSEGTHSPSVYLPGGGMQLCMTHTGMVFPNSLRNTYCLNP